MQPHGHKGIEQRQHGCRRQRVQPQVGVGQRTEQAVTLLPALFHKVIAETGRQSRRNQAQNAGQRVRNEGVVGQLPDTDRAEHGRYDDVVRAVERHVADAADCRTADVTGKPPHLRLLQRRDVRLVQAGVVLPRAQGNPDILRHGGGKLQKQVRREGGGGIAPAYHRQRRNLQQRAQDGQDRTDIRADMLLLIRHEHRPPVTPEPVGNR